MLRPMDPDLLHLRLAYFAQRRLRPAFPDVPHDDEAAEFRELEAAFVEEERAKVNEEAAQAPEEPRAFLEWFASLRERGPGQGDALFPWLESRATI